jgi:ABC-2 type transport system ATP-binding protein/lipopolysaccharide transport system ATP-binding protein
MERVQVIDVSKRYRVGEQSVTLAERISAAARVRRRQAEEFWPLTHVSFGVADSAALGIVGPNGAGKSTLLKLLTRITAPTQGVVRTRGRVAALLEVGTGFHPELTGRENVFLNGVVLGMTRRDVAARFDAIVEFSGVEPFLDTPVKRYSSGMYLRLAFAVAAHLEPDILVVDEVLAVGDAAFQRKCLGRMADAEREGRTVIFVSHDLDAVQRLCPQALWLEKGRVREHGPCHDVIHSYLASVSMDESEAPPDAPQTGPVVVRRLEVRQADVPAQGRDAVLVRDVPLDVDLHLEVRVPLPGLDVALYVTNSRGVRVLDECVRDTQEYGFSPGLHHIHMRIPPLLNAGEHALGVWVGTQFEDLVDIPVATRFRLNGSDGGRPNRATVLGLPMRVKQVDPHVR